MDWQNVIGDLPQEQQLELYQAIALYALKGEELELSPIAKVVFAFIKQTLASKQEELIGRQTMDDILVNLQGW